MNDKDNKIIALYMGLKQIGDVYQAVVEFIKTYNDER